MKPKISVITAVLNGERYVKSCLENVQKQNYGNYEHIIVDGGSNDQTLNIASKYSSTIIITAPGTNQSKAMNLGYLKSTGDIITYLNIDDYYSDKVFSLVAKNYKEESWDILVGSCNMIDADGKLISTSKEPTLEFKKMMEWWKYTVPLNPSSYFISKKFHNKIGLYDEKIEYSMDYDLLYRASLLSPKVNYTDKVLGNYRYHNSAKTHYAITNNISEKELINTQKKYFKHLTVVERMWLFVSYIKYRLTK